MSVTGTAGRGVRRFGRRRSLAAVTMLGLSSGVAYAQSSVTLYGSLDGGLRNLVNGTSAGGAALSMASNGVFRSNRLGFEGKEDLGGGYFARFDLEAGYILSTGANSSTTNQIFQRNSTVGLSGPFGQVDIGHQFTLQHRLIRDFEPFNLRYLGITEAAAVSGGTSGRDDNAIHYHGDFGPWTARAVYAPGGIAGSLASGTVLAGGLNYHTRMFKFGAGYTHRSNALSTNAANTAFFANDQYTAGGAVSLGPVDVMGGYSLATQGVPSTAHGETRNQYLWGGFRYQASPYFNVTAAYYDNANSTSGVDGRKDVAIVGITYSLSKSTLLYADVDYTHFTGGYVTNATLNPSLHRKQTGVSFGMNHDF